MYLNILADFRKALNSLYFIVLLGGDRGFSPALNAVVVGHWAQNGKYMEEHVNGKHHNVFIYDRNHEEPRDSMATSLKQQIIETLSFDGQTVLDTTETGSLKGHLVVIMRLDNFPGQMLHTY